jgi:hypothetical protein
MLYLNRIVSELWKKLEKFMGICTMRALLKKLQPLVNVSSCHHIQKNRHSESILFVLLGVDKDPFYVDLCRCLQYPRLSMNMWYCNVDYKVLYLRS